jgi:hypothetical protein
LDEPKVRAGAEISGRVCAKIEDATDLKNVADLKNIADLKNGFCIQVWVGLGLCGEAVMRWPRHAVRYIVQSLGSKTFSPYFIASIACAGGSVAINQHKSNPAAVQGLEVSLGLHLHTCHAGYVHAGNHTLEHGAGSRSHARRLSGLIQIPFASTYPSLTLVISSFTLVISSALPLLSSPCSVVSCMMDCRCQEFSASLLFEHGV